LDKDFVSLQLHISDLIRKTGSVENAIEFLQRALPESRDREDMAVFITFSVANFYGITSDQILGKVESKNEGYIQSDCRRVCYKVLNELFNMSYRKMGRIYNRKENAVMRAIKRMNEIISDPRLDVQSYKCYLHVKNIASKAIRISNETKQ
jgi:chromosomal replication initiation ATPase DnaA